MTVDGLEDFLDDFHSDIAVDAHSNEMLREHAFVEKMGEILTEYGEVRDIVPCHWMDRGFKVDAYFFEEDYSTVTIIVSHWLNENNLKNARVSNSDIDRIIKRAFNFLVQSFDGHMQQRIDVSNPAHELAGIIEECKADILSAKIVLITDGIAKERKAQSFQYNDIEISGVIWDISRTFTFVRTGKREQIEIDFVADYGGAISCVEQPELNGKYTAYLSFVPGNVLADLYRDWKIRLLERNVRVFLSQRPKVNRGIRDTIRNEPEMFCAYNNGITVYAKNIEFTLLPNGKKGISRVHDFQIVNGGQTTASLYHTREKFKSDLGGISVQMKLMIINESARPSDIPEGISLADVLVPKIGRYSNTQNKVQMADLLANDPPHPELHAISLHLTAPDPTGGSIQTYWFYERSRGSYEETRRLNAKTPAQRKKFDTKYPKQQRFDKSKFGKAWNSYRMLPHIVSLGAMKNFAQFNNWLQEQKDEDWTEFFRKTVALVLIWKETEKTVRRQKFGGYTHAIVTYTLAWLHKLTDMRIDLNRIWNEQAVDEAILNSIEALSYTVNQHIRNTELNVTEWCKKEACWNTLLEQEKPDLSNLSGFFITNKANTRYISPASAETKNVEFCMEKGASSWFELSSWLKDHGFMSGKQRSQAFNMGRTLNREKEPSSILAFACRRIWENAESSYGWSAGEKK